MSQCITGASGSAHTAVHNKVTNTPSALPNLTGTERFLVSQSQHVVVAWHVSTGGMYAANSEKCSCACSPLCKCDRQAATNVAGVQAKGFINEAHHTPDCNLGMPVWLPQAHPTLPSAPVNAGLAYSTASRKANEDHSWGYVVARSLWDEMLAAKGFG